MRSKKAILTIVANILLQLVTIVNGFLVPKIIINNFGSDVNGLIASITQFLTYISLLESGFGPVIKAALYKPIANKDKKTVASILKTSETIFRRIAIIFLFYILVLFIIYPMIINESFDRLFTITLIAIIGISTFAEYYFGMTYKLYLQAKQKTYVTSIIQMISYILSIVAVVILAKIGADVFAIKLASGLLFVLRPIIQNYYVKKKYNIKTGNEQSGYVLEKKWDGLAQHIAYVIHINTDITVLTALSSLLEVSVYSVYYLVVKGVKAIIQAFANGVDASFGDMIAKNEEKNLNKQFSIYEILYGVISSIAFSSTIVLITPFVCVYTKGVNDINYIRPLFGALIVISEYIWAIRQPYNLLVQAAGHFKETRKGAWVECLSNIVISVILVNWFGIIGVAIGTIVAMTIRTAEFVYHTNKYILHRSMWESIKKILLVAVETIIIVLLCNFLPYRENTDYLNWVINALMTFLIASVVVLGFNVVFFRKELSDIKSLLTSLLHRKKKN